MKGSPVRIRASALEKPRTGGVIYGPPVNPAAEVGKPSVGRTGDIEVFSPEEVMALVRAAASPQDAAIYLTAAFTGLRRGELLALRWGDVDFTGQVIRVRASDDDLVLLGVGGHYLDGRALSRRYVNAVRRAGLRELRFHDLRHTFGTRMIGKADIRRVQEWTGHADVQTMKYLHYV
jgi:integrase